MHRTIDYLRHGAEDRTYTSTVICSWIDMYLGSGYTHYTNASGDLILCAS